VKMFLKLHSAFIISSVFLIIVLCESTDAIDFFDEKIDYWNIQNYGIEGIGSNKKKNIKLEPKQSNSENVTNAEFKWRPYLQPKTNKEWKEFFREGNHIPPEPFMELVRDPSNRNIKHWNQYIEKKNTLMARVQLKIAEYNKAQGQKMGQRSNNILKASVKKLVEPSRYSNRLVFRMYYDSKCPHCKKMFGTLRELQKMGFYVEARQIDDDPEGLKGLGVLRTRADERELKKYGVKSTPFLLVGDRKEGKVYPMVGYQSVRAVFEQLKDSGVI